MMLVRIATLLAIAATLGAAGVAGAQQPREPLPRDLREPVYRVTDQLRRPTPEQPAKVAALPAKRSGVLIEPASPGEHPLTPAIRWAKEGIDDIRQIQDYTCTFVKRERIDGELLEHQFITMKVRHEPFSVYMNFLKPSKLKGQEVIYIRGQNDGKIWAHTTGIKHKLFGTVSLAPTSVLAMKDNRYPITEVGLLNMVQRLIEVGEHDSQYGECDVEIFKETKINDRSCTCIQVVHPVPRREFTFNIARIYVDEELNLPLRFEAYDWPREPGGEPRLTEEYTYLNLQLNNGFTDTDFDINNAAYQFN